MTKAKLLTSKRKLRRRTAIGGSMQRVVMRVRESKERRDTAWRKFVNAQSAYELAEKLLQASAKELVQCVEGNAHNEKAQ